MKYTEWYGNEYPNTAWTAEAEDPLLELPEDADDMPEPLGDEEP